MLGESTTGRGVVALSDTDYALRAASRTMPGIRASSQLGTAIEGWAKGSQVGVLGLSDGPGIGIAGRSNDGTGATGNSTNGTGVHGVNEAGNGDGVVGEGRRGVVGLSKGFQGVYGHSDSNAGVVGESQTMDGVWGISHNPQAAGVSGHRYRGLAEATVFVRRIGPGKDVGPTPSILGSIVVPRDQTGSASFLEPSLNVLFEVARFDQDGHIVRVTATRV